MIGIWFDSIQSLAYGLRKQMTVKGKIGETEMENPPASRHEDISTGLAVGLAVIVGLLGLLLWVLVVVRFR